MQPTLGETPEFLVPMEMNSSPDILIPFVDNPPVFPAHLQCHVPLELIGVVYTPGFSMLLAQKLQGLPLPIRHWRGAHLDSFLVDAQSDIFVMGNPSSTFPAIAAEHRLIQHRFYRESEGIPLLHYLGVDGLPEEPEGTLFGALMHREISATSLGYSSIYREKVF